MLVKNIHICVNHNILVFRCSKHNGKIATHFPKIISPSNLHCSDIDSHYLALSFMLSLGVRHCC